MCCNYLFPSWWRHKSPKQSYVNHKISFLAKPFSYMIKVAWTKFKYLEKEKVSKVKWKTFFIILKELSLEQIKSFFFGWRKSDFNEVFVSSSVLYNLSDIKWNIFEQPCYCQSFLGHINRQWDGDNIFPSSISLK